MLDTYKLSYGGNTVTYPGWNGYIQWQQPYYARYEYNLFGNNTSPGVSAGTVSMPFSAFDTIGIRTVWRQSQSINGNGTFIWYDKAQVTAATVQLNVPIILANTNNYCVFETTVEINNTNKTFTTLNNQSTMYGGIYTPLTSNAKWAQINDANRHNVIGQIIGVKYQ